MSQSVRMVAALGLVATAAACSGSTDEAGASGEAPSKVSIVIQNDLDTFNPFASAFDSASRQTYDALYDTLVRIAVTGKKVTVEPAMATKWSTTPDSATFTLRNDLTCADGTAITASGVARNLKLLADPKTGAFATGRIFGPAGAKSITADDAANTVKISLKAPYTYLVEALSEGYIVCPSALDDVAKLAKTPAPTGPYSLASSSRGETYTLARRDDYKAVKASTLPKSIELRVVEDDTTRANLISSGQVDIAPVLGRDVSRLEKSKKYVPGRAVNATSLVFNQAADLPGANKDVRTALSMAVDAAAYAKASSYGLGTPSDTIFTPNEDCYTSANGKLSAPFDLAGAKAALTKAGYGPGGKTLKIRLLGMDEQASGPELVLDAFKKIGVDVDLTKGDVAQVVDTLFTTGDWDVYIAKYDTASRIPAAVTSTISAIGSPDNPKFTRLVDQAAAAEGSQKCALWGQAEAAVLENVDAKPLVWNTAAWFTNDLTFQANYFYIDTRSIRHD